MFRTEVGRRHAHWLSVIVLTWAALLALAGACGGTSVAPEASLPASFDEGKIDIGVDKLDTGLVKGNVTVDAADGWRAVALAVTAHDPKGAKWSVLEFPEGVGSERAKEFFEVVLQELPRHEQIQITATVTFQNDAGVQAERQATDSWPP